MSTSVLRKALLVLASFALMHTSLLAQNPKALYIGMHWPNTNDGWASGTVNTLSVTLNGGGSWQSFSLKGDDTLQFRDVHGFNKDSCLVLAAGQGGLSRIYSFTREKGFTLRFKMRKPQGFLNAMALQNNGLGYAYGDALDSAPFLLKTTDYGQSWARVSAQLLPLAGRGEGGFASSGTCVNTNFKGTFIIGTGAGGNARLLVKKPNQNNWQAIKSPMPTGDFAGITTAQIVDTLWFIGGGNLADSTAQQSAFISFNQGESWQALAQRPSAGPIYGSALGKYNGGYVLVVCGPTGADASFDLGKTWQNINKNNIWTCHLADENSLWLGGKKGILQKVGLESVY